MTCSTSLSLPWWTEASKTQNQINPFFFKLLLLGSFSQLEKNLTNAIIAMGKLDYMIFNPLAVIYRRNLGGFGEVDPRSRSMP